MNAKAFSVGILAAIAALGFLATAAMGVTLPSQANSHATDATAEAGNGADVTGHPDAEVNGVPLGPPVWLNDSAPYGPPEWTNTSGGPPSWLTLPES